MQLKRQGRLRLHPHLRGIMRRLPALSPAERTQTRAAQVTMICETTIKSFKDK